MGRGSKSPFLPSFFLPSLRRTHSVTGTAGFVAGLGVRAVRARSIGRDEQRFGESPKTPIAEAGSLGPRPLHEETSPL